MSSLLLLLLTLFGGVSVASERPADFDERIRAFEKNTGLDLHVVGDRSEPGTPPGANAEPVDPVLVARFLPLIERVMMHYPPSVRGRLITDMYLYGKLRMAGKPFLGAARPDKNRFDLAIRPRTPEHGLKSTLYHEMSHLIEFDEEFPVERWVALSKPYSGRLDQQPELKSRSEESWYNDGFVSRYASKDRHEDFAELAEVAFTNPDRANELAKQYPIIGNKLELLTEIYKDYAPGMELPWTSEREGDGAGRPPEPVDPPARPPAVDPPAPEEPARPARPQRRLDENGNPIPAES